MSQKLRRKPSQKLGHETPKNAEGCEHWNRLPDSVLYDTRLSASSRCVYAVLAGSVFQGTVSTIGQRRIAARLGFSKNTVTAAIRELAACGRISVLSDGKQRYRYHLHSDVFGQKQRDGIQEMVSFPNPRLVSTRSA